MAVDLTVPEPGTAEWYLLRLLHRLELRAPALRTWEAYYDGEQPLAFASRKFQEAFGDRFPVFASNFCSLVVEGTAERLEVQSFRGFGSPELDEQVWRTWQENDLDAASQMAFVEAMIKGTAYGLVEPTGVGGMPRITVEDALDAIVEHDPRDRSLRRAGLKRWLDDEQRLVLVLYLPDEVRKYRSTKAWDRDLTSWWRTSSALETAAEVMTAGSRMWRAAGLEPWQGPDDAEWPLPNPLGVVPLVELPNRPRLKTGGQSEIKPVRSNQDAINKYRADALITSEFAAFPQRYLLNYEPEVDEATGRSIEPFRAAIDRLWTVPPPDPETPDAPEPKIGSLPSASLEPYARQIELEVGHMSSISRLPYHYLLGTPQSTPPSGESLKASEAGLEHKTSRGKLFMGEALEELMRVAMRAQGATVSRSAETVWVDSETRSEAVRTDAIVKLHQQGIIDDELAWELSGLSPSQIRSMQLRAKEREAAGPSDEDLEAAAAAAAAAERPVVPAPTGPRMST